MSVALYLTGEVKQYISLDPGGYVALWSEKNKSPKGHVKIINNHNTPIKITGIETDMKNRVKWHLREVKPGYVFELEVEDISNKNEIYVGLLHVKTNHPKKPKLTMTINRHKTTVDK